jgi:N6-L-threonylcarbamoyladenine synthase/protein kinase Bud32
MVAHLEIGRHRSGFSSPVCLNASGANAHLLGYRDGRYRVLGETMDTGVGNALDKFTRHVGWSHPGGPKVEAAAEDGSYVDLPYVVKGMDFSFSGLTSAAKEAHDGSADPGATGDASGEDHAAGGGVPVEDVCFSLQEHVFAMLTEVAERALSLTGTDELVLGGGVGQNARLREMLSEMCAARGADFFAPEARFLRDNAGMIAVLGAKMYAAGDTVAVADSAVDPEFRPDEVPVTWHDADDVARGRATGADDDTLLGAEAAVTMREAEVVKRRRPKSYRHRALDERLRRERTVAEARTTSEARRAGVPTPLVRDVDLANATLRLQRVGEADLADRLSPELAREVGRQLARLHAAGVVHGDPTTRNVRVGSVSGNPTDAVDAEAADGGDAAGAPDGPTADQPRAFLVDFGLAYHSGHVEDHAMDLHVFAGSVRGTADDPDPVLAAVEAGYEAVGDPAVLDRLREVEGRGRYR